MLEKDDGPSKYVLFLMEREDVLTDYVIGEDYRILFDQALGQNRQAGPEVAEPLFFKAFSMFLDGLQRLHADPKQYERWNEWGGNRKIPGGIETIMSVLHERYGDDLEIYGDFIKGIEMKFEGSEQSKKATEYRSRFDNVTYAIGRYFGENLSTEERTARINKVVADLKRNP